MQNWQSYAEIASSPLKKLDWWLKKGKSCTAPLTKQIPFPYIPRRSPSSIAVALTSRVLVPVCPRTVIWTWVPSGQRHRAQVLRGEDEEGPRRHQGSGKKEEGMEPRNKEETVNHSAFPRKLLVSRKFQNGDKTCLWTELYHELANFMGEVLCRIRCMCK